MGVKSNFFCNLVQKLLHCKVVGPMGLQSYQISANLHNTFRFIHHNLMMYVFFNFLVQCSAVQCSAVQCSALKFSAVKFSAVQCSAPQGTVRFSCQHALLQGWQRRNAIWARTGHSCQLFSMVDQCIVYSVQCTVYSVPCTVRSVHSALYNLAVHRVYCQLLTVHCISA